MLLKPVKTSLNEEAYFYYENQKSGKAFCYADYLIADFKAKGINWCRMWRVEKVPKKCTEKPQNQTHKIAYKKCIIIQNNIMYLTCFQWELISLYPNTLLK